jgi:hypothetical protein
MFLVASNYGREFEWHGKMVPLCINGTLNAIKVLLFVLVK